MTFFSRFHHQISALRYRCSSGAIGSSQLRLWQEQKFVNIRHGCNSSLPWSSVAMLDENKQPTPSQEGKGCSCRGFASIDTTVKGSQNLPRIHNTSIDEESSSSKQFPHEYYQPYEQAVANIFASTEFKSKKRSYIERGLWTEKMFQQFEDWLLSKQSAVDTIKCWGPLKEKWIVQLARNIMKYEEGGSTMNYKMQFSCTSELVRQAKTLQSKIFAKPDNAKRKNTSDDNALLGSKAQMMRFVFHELLDYSQRGGASFIMPIVWYKLKESGTIIERPQLKMMLNIMKQSAVKNYQHHHGEQSTSLELFMEELVMYHDLIVGVTSETFVSQHFSVMLKYHCQRGDMNVALSLLKKIESYESTPFNKDDHYMLVLATLVENGHFRGPGIELFDKIASNMYQAYSINQTSAIRLHNALAKEFGNLYTKTTNLVEWNPTEDVPIRDVPAKGNELLACRAEIDPSTGSCNVTNMQLRNNSLTQAQRKQMYKDLLELGEKANAAKELKEFSDWMDNRKGRPFTIILDGANIGTVESVVETLERNGENPLVILPAGDIQKRTAINSYALNNKVNLYTAPDTIDDDLLCMLATVSDQKTACGSNSKGVRSILITNDQFIDHRENIRDQPLFWEWYTRHCHKHGQNKASSMKIPTNVFNRRIRCHEWSDSNGGKVWHFPVSGWGRLERFVVRIPFALQK